MPHNRFDAKSLPCYTMVVSHVYPLSTEYHYALHILP